MGKDDVLRGFHDVCRHRAYKVTKKPTGTALVLGCKYHGWCYDTKGKLIKAPQFENVKSFNKSENGLFEIKVRVDANGFVFASLDPKTMPLDTESVLQNIDDCRRLRGLDSGASPVASWDLEANFNWKLTEESYMNVNILRPPRFAGGLLSQLLFDTGRGTLNQKKVFRNAVAVEISNTLWCLITLLPTSATQTVTRVEILSTRPMIKSILAKQVHESLQAHIQKDLRVLEDKFGALGMEDGYVRKHRRCIDTELTATRVPRNGSEEQLRILSCLNAHLKLERTEGKEIWPAEQARINDTACDVANQRKYRLLPSSFPIRKAVRNEED